MSSSESRTFGEPNPVWRTRYCYPGHQIDETPDPLRIGVGIHFGAASVGNVRKGGQKDFTAVGDVVNTAARLQAAAGPGEIVVADAVFERLATRPERAEYRFIEVKGKSEALPVYVLPRGA